MGNQASATEVLTGMLAITVSIASLILVFRPIFAHPERENWLDRFFSFFCFNKKFSNDNAVSIIDFS